MKIKVAPRDLYKAIICLEIDCPYKKECANHTSAGDFRSEEGFKPEIYINNGDVVCDTKNQPLINSDIFIHFPANYYELGVGMVLWSDIKE